MNLTQTRALCIDAYRELNSRRLFWITLILSLFVVGLFALVGLNERGLVLAFWTIELDELNSNIIPASVFYKNLFTGFGITIWLTWIAAILALISTATIFPDLVSAGAIDLVLSKPIGRLRLFLTKYFFGLLFVALQVTVFTGASFLVLGWRGGVWEPRLFLAIPIVLVFFSYLFSICATLGVITKSTLASILLTLLVWFLVFIIHSTESTVLMLKVGSEEKIASLELNIDSTERHIRDLEGMEQSEAVTSELKNLRERIVRSREELESSRASGGTIRTIHGISIAVKTVLPKTSETIGLLDRYLFTAEEMQPPSAPQGDRRRAGSFDDPAVVSGVIEEVRQRSIGWIVGTSLLFEAFILGIGAWVFCRRDY